MSDPTTDPPTEPEAPENPSEPPETPPSEPEAPVPPGTPGEELSGPEAKARREARNLRAQLKTEREEHSAAVEAAKVAAKAEASDEIGALRQQVAERDAMLAGVGKFRDPRDVARYIDVMDTPADKLGEEIDRVLKERPYLAVGAPANGHLPQGQQSEPGGGEKADEWLRDVMLKRH